MSKQGISFIILLVFLTTTVSAKNKGTGLLGKVFQKVVLKGVDKALEDLDKGKNSKIIQYYTSLQNESDSDKVDFLDDKRIVNNKIVNEFSQNGITMIVKYPKNVKAGETFLLEVKMINDFKDARMGGLTLSFPQYSELYGSIANKKFDKVTPYSPPEKMYSGTLKKNISINYFVIEGWENKWSQDTTRYMNISLRAPDDVSNLKVNVRGLLILGKGKNKQEIVSPLSDSLIADQQGYLVKRIKIEID